MIFRDEDEMRMAYREVFDTPVGRKVLSDLAEELQFISNVGTNADSLLLSNFFKVILQKCGAWGDTERIVNAIMGG